MFPMAVLLFINFHLSNFFVLIRSFKICFQNGEIVPPQVSVGDKVLLPEYGGTRVEIEDNKEYHLFRETDILAKLEM
jgi:co-chaperonin GroES (HSP10)